MECLQRQKARTEIHRIPWKSADGRGARAARYLRLQERERARRKSRIARTDIACRYRSAARVEAKYAAVHLCGNGSLYAVRQLYICVNVLLCDLSVHFGPSVAEHSPLLTENAGLVKVDLAQQNAVGRAVCALDNLAAFIGDEA